MLTPAEVEALFGISKVIVYEHGLEIVRKARYPMPKSKPPQRKGIYEMSKKSKLKMTHIVQNSNVKFNSILTLTYGDFIFPTDGKELKRQLNIILTKMRRRWPVEYLWFLEFTKRGRPHIHIFMTRIPTEWDRLWLATAWSKISIVDCARRATESMTGEYGTRPPTINIFDVLDEAKKVYSVHVHPKAWEKVRKVDGAARYALKYATKAYQKDVPNEYGNVGRFWGVSTGVEAKPIGETIIGETMSEEQIKRVIAHSKGGQSELIPKYLFQRDALDFFTKHGLHLTEIFGDKSLKKLDQSQEK